MRDKVVKNGPSGICRIQPLTDHVTSNFLKVVFHKCVLGPFFCTWSILLFQIAFESDDRYTKTYH